MFAGFKLSFMNGPLAHSEWDFNVHQTSEIELIK